MLISPDIVKDSLVSYGSEDSEQFKTIVVFDCRGVEPVEFSPRVCHVALSAHA